MTDKSEQSGWHLDKRVPVSIIGGFIVQTFLLGWFISALDGRVSSVEAAIKAEVKDRAATDFRQWDRIRASDQKDAAMNATLSALATSMKNVERDVNRIFTILDHRKESGKDIP